jgi:hypothetical protein
MLKPKTDKLKFYLKNMQDFKHYLLLKKLKEMKVTKRKGVALRDLFK